MKRIPEWFIEDEIKSLRNIAESDDADTYSKVVATRKIIAYKKLLRNWHNRIEEDKAFYDYNGWHILTEESRDGYE